MTAAKVQKGGPAFWDKARPGGGEGLIVDPLVKGPPMMNAENDGDVG